MSKIMNEARNTIINDIDTKTKNKSFIKMAKILKRLGINNRFFFLKLYDKGLQGVNPHDPNLSVEMQTRITNECVRNPWYFLREVVRIPEPGGTINFQLHRGNLALAFCMLNNINLIQLLPRQHGKTISAICVYVWIYHFATENSNILFINKEFTDSKENLKRFKNISEQLPEYLKFKHKKDVDNEEYIKCTKNNNTIKAVSVANTPPEADKKGLLQHGSFKTFLIAGIS